MGFTLDHDRIYIGIDTAEEEVVGAEVRHGSNKCANKITGHDEGHNGLMG
ncbi:hypothetical protein ACLK2A_00670 [Escherichia coli]